MELESSLSVKQLNRQFKAKKFNHKIQKNVSKEQVCRRVKLSIGHISNVMRDLVPKSRHSMNDIHVLESTVKYLKQTTDFRRGINLCTVETKAFLYDRHFDSKSMNKLIKEITHRISNIPEPEYAEVSNFQAVTTAANDGWPSTTRKQIADSLLPENWQRDPCSLATGVLLDLSMKQNRKKDCVSFNSETSTPVAGLCGNSRKREILEKIRKKILDKRRLSGVARVNFDDDKDLMWRPWRV